MRIVQVVDAGVRRVGLVDVSRLILLDAKAAPTAYAVASQAIRDGRRITEMVDRFATGETVDYEAIYTGASNWRLLPSFDHPEDDARCVVSGTGLTHKASAENRAAMHKKEQAEITDSMRMYQMGLEGGNPEPGRIGVQPEWFYKGNGSVLRAHGEGLEIPAYGWDGGEEPEIAGIYLVSPEGQPVRVGMTVANEFSDHQMEKKNYLYLAPSKLRNCSIGPELTVGDVEFHDTPGIVRVLRHDQPVWSKEIWSGQKNMSYSVANLEHHHFKYEMHRRPGDVHVHFFGADAFSFGDGLKLEAGDVMEVSFPQFGRALRNTLQIAQPPETLVTVAVL